MKKLKIIQLFLILLGFVFSKSNVYAASGYLSIPQSVTEPISPNPYVKVYVKRFTIPATINVTDVSGSISLNSGLPYIAQGAFGVWYNANGNCPADNSVYPNYSTIWNGENISLLWMNTISSKIGTVQVPTIFHFPVKRTISGCGFMTFDLASYPNSEIASSGLTLSSDVTLHYDTDTPVLPQPYLSPVGGEICFGSNQGCNRATTCTSSSCAFMHVTKISSPTYLWSLFGDANTGVFTGAPYANAPSGSWSASEDTFIYKSCTNLANGFSGPADYYSQIPQDAIPLLSVPMQSQDNNDVVVPVNKYFSTPIQLKPGNCLVNLTRLSATSGGFMVNTAVYALLQASPSATIGNLDKATCDALEGWTGNKELPTASLDVHFYSDGVGPSHFIGKTTANQPRDKTICDNLGVSQFPCNHGFSFTVPDSLKDGKPHTIDAYAINGSDNPKLTGSNRLIACALKLPGDINNDGRVNLADLDDLKANFGRPYTLLDYNLIATNFGK